MGWRRRQVGCLFQYLEDTLLGSGWVAGKLVDQAKAKNEGAVDSPLGKDSTLTRTLRSSGKQSAWGIMLASLNILANIVKGSM